MAVAFTRPSITPESLEAMLAHHLGIRVVCPASPARVHASPASILPRNGGDDG